MFIRLSWTVILKLKLFRFGQPNMCNPNSRRPSLNDSVYVGLFVSMITVSHCGTRCLKPDSYMWIKLTHTVRVTEWTVYQTDTRLSLIHIFGLAAFLFPKSLHVIIHEIIVFEPFSPVVPNPLQRFDCQFSPNVFISFMI